MKRVLTPSLNPSGLGAAAAAIYAAVIMVWHAAHHQGVIDPQVLAAGAGAAWLIYTRFKVTPVADPRDHNGNPLHGPLAADSGSKPAPAAVPPPALPPTGTVTVVPGQPAPPPAAGPRM